MLHLVLGVPGVMCGLAAARMTGGDCGLVCLPPMNRTRGTWDEKSSGQESGTGEEVPSPVGTERDEKHCQKRTEVNPRQDKEAGFC